MVCKQTCLLRTFPSKKEFIASHAINFQYLILSSDLWSVSPGGSLEVSHIKIWWFSLFTLPYYTTFLEGSSCVIKRIVAFVSWSLRNEVRLTGLELKDFITDWVEGQTKKVKEWKGHMNILYIISKKTSIYR